MALDVRYLVDPVLRDEDRVYAALDVPLEVEMMEFPYAVYVPFILHLCRLGVSYSNSEDMCEAACRFRANFCHAWAGSEEWALNSKIGSGRRCAQILQEHATFFPEVDQAGFCTMIWVVSGEQIYYLDNPCDDVIPITDVRFSESVAGRTKDTKSWVPSLLRKGDML